MSDRPRQVFVTGKLAEPALRRVLADLAPAVGFEPDVVVLPITVAALMTTDWIAKRLTVPAGTQRVVLPGMCRGDLAPIEAVAGVTVVRGPKDLRDLPEFFGKRSGPPPGYGAFDIEILAEINHAPQKPLAEILAVARHFRDSGADIIDLGCDPGGPWAGVGDTVRGLRAEGFRVSIDSFDPAEVEAALAAGAELVLSVNGTNVEHARRWHEHFPDVEAVAIPDTPTDLASLDRTIVALAGWGVKFRADPILEPIGFGFAASLGRYLEVRRKYPDVELMMGVGNLTELTDVDSAGVNVLLAGFCQEVGVRSVLTTEVINWCRSSVKEFDLARRLVHHAVTNGVLPKHLEPGLVLLRDRKLFAHGPGGLAELAARITDRNYRLFAEGGDLHVLNGSMHLHGTDPFGLFAEIERRDDKLDPSHAFYLGYELAKAVTALTLGKQYTQDQALDWGILTRPETSHRNPGERGRKPPDAAVAGAQQQGAYAPARLYTGTMPPAVTPLVEELLPYPDPWDVARKLAHLPHLLFLDSADRHPDRGRYSYVTADPVSFTAAGAVSPDSKTPFRLDGLLASLLPDEPLVPVPGLPPFQGGLAGLFGYGLGREFEQVPPPRVDEFDHPDVMVGEYRWVISFDHIQGRAWLVGQPPIEVRELLSPVVGSAVRTVGAPPVRTADPTPSHPLPGFPNVTSNFTRGGYLAAVRRAIEYIRAGDIFQVNLSQRLLAPLTEHPLDLYGRLRQASPAPFACYFDAGDFQIASASPERFLQVSPDGWVSTKPIKGTRPRGMTSVEDAALLRDLTTSPKDRAENVMIVDLLRNDLGRVCEFGSVTVPKVCEVESYRDVHHLVSEVRGRLRAGLTPFDLLRAAFPGGSVTGAPKVRAMEIIAELEPTARGPYCGSVGFVGFDGSMDTNILIRTFTAGRGWVQFPVGGGIVADSDPEREYEETLHKAAGLLRALKK
ncbi:MAG: aminodeoxychorismate synthase component I [Gemmataceae bacterium]